KRHDLRPNTVRDYEWALCAHLLPHFGRLRLGQITIAEVARSKRQKAREGRLSPVMINKTLTGLAQVLAAAVDDGYIARNPARGEAPLPPGITAHKLRHTFASLLAACGEDPAYVMAQLGHADPRFTLRVYTHLMSRRDGERERLRALVEGAEWALTGTSTDST